MTLRRSIHPRIFRTPTMLFVHQLVLRARLLASVALALGLPAAALAGQPEPGFTDTLAVGGLTLPTGIAFLPDGRLLVTEKAGALKLAEEGVATTLITLPVCTAFELGLLGIALDPAFESNGYVYLYRSKPAPAGCSGGAQNQVVRITFGPGDVVNPASLVEIFPGIPAALAHNGGGIRFGSDGMLYVGVGENTLQAPAQDLGQLRGKVLRIQPDGTAPADNPFAGQAGARAEIFAFGFRNPYRFDFDPVSGLLWLGDVGNLTIEEIDVVRAGGNYGWPHCEGTLPPGCEQPGNVPPIFEYPHSGPGALGVSIIGGPFAGTALGPFANQYVFADFGSGGLYRVAVSTTRDEVVGQPVAIVTEIRFPVDVIRGPDGAVYYVAYDGFPSAGEVRRVATTGGTDVPISGHRLLLRSDSDPARRGLQLLSKDPAITIGTGGDDPTMSGAELRVAGSGFDDVYPLPASGWAAKGTKLTYSDPELANGPVSSILIKAGKRLKVKASGAALGHVLGADDPGPVNVTLLTGLMRHCLSFGGTPTFKPDRLLKARGAPAPAECEL